MPLIDLRDVKKTYQLEATQVHAVNGISFSIDEGDFVAIMGPSGSGKSTLLHILGLLDRPTSGHYYFKGRETSTFSDDELASLRNQQIGFIFQTFNLLKKATVFENVKLPLLYSDIPPSQWDQLVYAAIEAVGLSERIDHESSQLSGGEQQRVAIARAVVNNPSLILADEPTGNLDSKSGGLIMDIIQNLNQKGHTVVLITHETYTSEYAKRIIRLKDGKLTKIDTNHKKKKKRKFKK